MASEKSYGRMTDAVNDGTAIPFQYEGTDYCVLRESLQREGEEPFVSGYGFDHSNNGYRFEWFIAPDFWNIEEEDFFKHLSKAEALLHGIILDKPIRVEFDQVWPL